MIDRLWFLCFLRLLICSVIWMWLVNSFVMCLCIFVRYCFVVCLYSRLWVLFWQNIEEWLLWLGRMMFSVFEVMLDLSRQGKVLLDSLLRKLIYIIMVVVFWVWVVGLRMKNYKVRFVLNFVGYLLNLFRMVDRIVEVLVWWQQDGVLVWVLVYV